MTTLQGQSKGQDDNRLFSNTIGKADGSGLEQRAASRLQRPSVTAGRLWLDTYCVALRSTAKGNLVRRWCSRVAGIGLACDRIRARPRKPSASQLVCHVIAAAAECSAQRRPCDFQVEDPAPRPVIELDGGVLHRKVGAAVTELGLRVVYGPASPRLYR